MDSNWERDTLAGAAPTPSRGDPRKVEVRLPRPALVHRSVVGGEVNLVSDCAVPGKNRRAHPRVGTIELPTPEKVMLRAPMPAVLPPSRALRIFDIRHSSVVSDRRRHSPARASNPLGFDGSW